MALSPEVLKWFYETQKQLKEQFELDTSKPEDMGRLKTVHLYKENEAGERVPLGLGEPITDPENMVADVRYATAARAENGRDYANPMPESVDKRLDWIQKSQRTFHVTEGEGGTLTMSSNMSDQELMQIYNEAKDGRLTVSKPGGDVRNNNGTGMFLCVDKDSMPTFCDSGFAYMKDLSIEQLEQFYQRHPEMLDRKIEDKEALTLARIELTDLNKMESPGMSYDHITASMQGMQSGSLFDENVKWWDEYENLALRQMHANAVPATYQQAAMMQRTIPSMLMQQNIQHDLAMGDGLDKFMVTDGNLEMPLFPDHKEMKARLKAGDLHAIADMQRRLGEAALGGNLTYFSRDPQNPGQYKGFHFAKNSEGKLTTEPLPTKKPTLPWYKSVFSIFFRADVAKYRKDTAAYESYERMKPICEMMTDPESQPEVKEPAKKAPDPKKAARKEKLAKMTPEERFEYDVAEQVQRIYQKTTNPRIYLKMCKVTADDVQKDPGFKEFMQSEKMQTAMDKKLHGTEAEKGKIFPGILAQDYVNETTRKAKEIAQASATGNAAPKTSMQTGAPQNSAAQNTNQKKSGPVMGGH